MSITVVHLFWNVHGISRPSNNLRLVSLEIAAVSSLKKLGGSDEFEPVICSLISPPALFGPKPLLS